MKIAFEELVLFIIGMIVTALLCVSFLFGLIGSVYISNETHIVYLPYYYMGWSLFNIIFLFYLVDRNNKKQKLRKR